MGKLGKSNIILKSTVDGVRDIKDLVEEGSNLGIKIYFVKEGENEFVTKGSNIELSKCLKGLDYTIIKEFGKEEYEESVKEEDSENIQIIGRSLYNEVNTLIDNFDNIKEESDTTLIDYIEEVKEHEPILYKIRRSLGEEVVVKDLGELDSKLYEELNKGEVKLDIILKTSKVFRQILELGLEEGEVKLKGIQYVTVKGVYQPQTDGVLRFKDLAESVTKVSKLLK